MTGAAVLFTIMMALLKIVRAELSPFDVLFWRGATAAPLALAMCWPVGLRLYRPGLVLVRTLWGTGTVLLLAYSAKELAVADMTLLFRLQPILVAILAPLVLGRKERAGRAIWLVLIVSILGVGLILAPSLTVGSRYGIAALCAGACSACAHVTVRALMRTDDPRIVVFYFQVGSMLVALVAVFLFTGQLPGIPSSDIFLPMLGVGLTSVGGQILMTFAYRADRAPIVAAASYSGVFFSVVIDIVYFGLFPGANIWVGGALVVGAGLWLIIAVGDAGQPARTDAPES